MSTLVRTQYWAGVVSRDGSSPEALLERMLMVRAGNGFSWCGERGAAALGPPLARSDFMVARVDRLLLALDGRLDNRAELAHAVNLSRSAPLSHILAYAYRDHGFDLPQHLAGDFALAIYDSALAALLLARDAVGARPLYYTEAGGSIAFAPALEPLRHALARKATPRLHAVAQLLCAPQTLAPDETFLSGIRALPPAHVLISTGTGTRTREYWKADGGAYADLNFQDCVDEYRALFRQSVKRRVAPAGRTAVLVSGGLDSSSIFCVAHEVSSDVIGIHHGAQDGGPADETMYLGLLERPARHIERIALEPAGYPGLIAASVQESEAPIADDLPALGLRIAEMAREAGASVVLNGTWADQVLFPMPPGYLVDALRTLQWARLAQHLRNFPRWFQDVPRSALWSAVARDVLRSHLPAVLPYTLRRMRGPRGLERLLNAEVRAGTRAPPTPVAHWSEQRSAHARAIERSVRSRLDTLTVEWYAKAAALRGLQAALPFLDRELLTLLITAPGSAQNQDGTPKALLRASMRGIVPNPILERRSKGDYTAVTTAALNAGTQRVFAELRSGRAVSYGFLDAAAFSRDLAHLTRQAHIAEADTARMLASLYAVECWLRHFCGA